jgi:hypothetical protein
MCDRHLSKFELCELEMAQRKKVNKSCFKHKNLSNANPNNWNEWCTNVTMRACLRKNPQKETERQQKKGKKSPVLDSFFRKWLSLISDHPPTSSGVISLTKYAPVASLLPSVLS